MLLLYIKEMKIKISMPIEGHHRKTADSKASPYDFEQQFERKNPDYAVKSHKEHAEFAHYFYFN
jgi:hypothetical protein